MKKKIVVIIACCVIIAMFFSCFFLFRTKNIDPLVPYGIIKKTHLKYDSIDKFNNVYIVSANNKYGFLDKNYELMGELSFDTITESGNQYVVLHKGDRDSLFDKDGVLIINAKSIKLVTNVYGKDAYYVCNDKCKLYYDQKVIYEGNENVINLIDKYALFDGFMIDVTSGGKTYYRDYYNDEKVNIIILRDNSCMVFNFENATWKKYDNYDDYMKTIDKNKARIDKNYYMDYSKCDVGAYLTKDGNDIIKDCSNYYVLTLEKDGIYIGTNNKGIRVFFENGETINATSYEIIGNYLMLDDGEKKYYDFKGEKKELSCPIVGYFDGKYICNDGLNKYFVDDNFEMVSDKYKGIDCLETICFIKNQNNMYAIYGEEFLTDFVYYDYYVYDNLLVGYYIDSLDVLELGNSFELVKKEDIYNKLEVYSDLEIINTIYQYDLKPIEDIIKKNKELFTIYAETAKNNPDIKDYLDRVLLSFKTLCINKDYLDLDYFIGRLKTLKIYKSDKVSIENAAGVYNKNSNEIKVIDDSDRVMLHELTHFIDFSINNDKNNNLYDCDGKVTIIEDINNYKYINKDSVCEGINDFNRFMVEAGAEYYASIYYNNYMVTSYHNYVSIYALLSKIYGEENMKYGFLAEDGYKKVYEILMESGLSLSDVKDFFMKISYLIDFNADYKGQYYFDVSDYLVSIIKETGINWYENKEYCYIIRGLLNNVVVKDGIDGIGKMYDSINMDDYIEYCFYKDDFKDIQQNILDKATTLYTVGGVKSTALVWDDHSYITFTTYYTNYTDWKSSLYYVIVDYDFDNEKVNSYKFYPIYS